MRSPPAARLPAISRVRHAYRAAPPALMAAALLAGCRETQVTQPATSVAEFEQRLESLRADAHLPAISAALVKDQRIVWARGFGTADLATGRPAADTTAYHLASLTKPFAATVLLQLVEEGKVSLDDPVSAYGVALGSPGTVRVRHLLSHTSAGVPGTGFAYDGNRFSLLDSVVARAAGRPFAVAVQERIIAPLGLRHTAPNPQTAAFAASGQDPAAFEANLARGYSFSGGSQVPTAYPRAFNTAAGLTSSVLDVAEFSMALDRDALLRPSSKALAFTPVVTPAGETLPYGLGWFATAYRGVWVVWHYGLWTANSSLIVKVPDRGLTFVVLGNSDALSAAYPLGAGRLETSPWARAFLDAFVIGEAPLP
jgi:CubicO group peptidase (beta-lactamase class C family)